MNRDELTRLVDSPSRRFAEGTEEERGAARDEAAEELRRFQAHETAMTSGLPEFRRSDIEWGKFGRVEVAGEFFKVIRGQVNDPRHSSAAAWCISEDNEVIWLERTASGPRNRAQLDAQRAQREAKRTAVKQRPSCVTR